VVLALRPISLSGMLLLSVEKHIGQTSQTGTTVDCSPCFDSRALHCYGGVSFTNRSRPLTGHTFSRSRIGPKANPVDWRKDLDS
jgi:hypothetical protein